MVLQNAPDIKMIQTNAWILCLESQVIVSRVLFQEQYIFVVAHGVYYISSLHGELFACMLHLHIREYEL